MASEKVAVVTGSNKGIGYAIVKGLCQKFSGKVYLTSRDVQRGEEAVKKLNDLGLKPLYHQLDISNQESINIFRDYLKQKHGGLDLLINNAGIAYGRDSTEPLGVQAEKTININYFSNLNVCEALFPLLRNNGKVVNISSSVGHLSWVKSEDLRKKLSDPKLTIPDLTNLMKEFVKSSKEEKSNEWNVPAYIVSKVGLSALSIIQQRIFDAETPNRNIAVNHVHPGFVDTDLIKGYKGQTEPVTIDVGATAPLFCALEADFKGKYVWSDSQIVDWYSSKTPAFV